MKKQKKDMITFAVMTFLASFMIFICLMMLIGTFRVMDTNQKQINGADIIILLKCDDPVLNFKLREIIQGNKKLTQYESTKYLSVQGKYRKKGTHNWSEYPFDICSYDDERNVQTTSVDTEGFSGKDILLPVYMSTFFSVGDIMQLKIEDNQYEFRVAGFNEDFLYSSPMNMGIYLVYISGEYYENIEFENPEYAIPGRNVKMKFTRAALKNHADASEEADNIYSELNTWVQSYKKEHPEYHGDVYGNFIPAELMKTASMIMPFIFVAFLLVFALIILLIAFVIIDFSVKNFILDNMKNTGIMEAGGYTVSELILILLTQLLSVALVGSLSGVILGAALQEKIGGIMLFLLGLNWNQQASFSLMASVLIGSSLVITVVTLGVGRE